MTGNRPQNGSEPAKTGRQDLTRRVAMPRQPYGTAISRVDRGAHLQLLIATGEALYGDRWQSSCARALGVTDRTMRFWVSGHRPTPQNLPRRLLELIDSRANLVTNLRGALVQAIGPGEEDERV